MPARAWRGKEGRAKAPQIGCQCVSINLMGRSRGRVRGCLRALAALHESRVTMRDAAERQLLEL